jgi:hypothetical protein
MLNVIRNWVIKTMMKSKGETGIVKTIPKRDLVELNTQVTAQRLMENGIDPNSLKNTNQVENAIIAIENRPKIQEGIRSTPEAKVFDMEGKEIDPRSRIMGGKQAETEAEILARIEEENKKGIEGLKQKMKKEQARSKRISGNLRNDNQLRGQTEEIGKPKIDEDEYEYYREILDDEENFVVQGDETREQLDAMVKEAEDEVAYMKRLYDKGALDPKPGEKGRKKFLDRKAQKGDEMSSEEIEELKELSEDPEDFAQGGRAGFKAGLNKLFKEFLERRKFLKTMVGNTEKNKKARELEMLKKAMEDARKNPGFEFPSGNELRTELEKKIGPTLLKDRKLNSDGGRAGFKAGLGKRFLDLLKGKPKLKFDERRFREGPIDLDFLEKIDKKDLAPFIRTRDTGGPGGYGMYDNFADMPAGLRAVELIKTIKGPRNEINYKAAELFLGKKLKGNETANELIQMLNRQEMRADGGRIGYNEAGVVDPGLAEDLAFKNAMEGFKYYLKSGGKKNFKDYMRMATGGYKEEQFRADGGRIGYFMGGANPRGLGLLREILKYSSKKGQELDKFKGVDLSALDMLRLSNPKTFNKMLEDVKGKVNVREGIMGTDTIRAQQEALRKQRKNLTSASLDIAKDMKARDDIIAKRIAEEAEKTIIPQTKKMMMEGMGMSEEAAEKSARDMAKVAQNMRLTNDSPRITEEGILQLENVLKNMETGGKKKRDLNADGGRIGFKDGMSRRTFLKLLGGLASIPIIGKIVKPIKLAKGVKNVPIIKTENVAGKPEWFDALVNKVIIEGDEVTKKFATGERQSIHQKTLDDGSVVRVTEDVDDGAIRVEYESEQNTFADTVQLEYKKPLPDEGAPDPVAEFSTAESGPVGRQTGPDDYDIDVDEVGGRSISDLDSDVSKLKEYATGKKLTMKEFIQSKKRRDRAKDISVDLEAQSDAVTRRQGDYDPNPDDFASGGIARMLGE